MKQVAIFTIPGKLQGNPYLSRTYQGVPGLATDGISYTVEPYSTGGILWALMKGRRSVIHVHWETTLYGSRYVAVALLRMLVRFPLLVLARLAGIPLVWTMHNARAHDYPHPRIDAFGKSIVAALASVTILQVKQVRDTYALRYPHRRVVYIPHPHYIGAYGDVSEHLSGELRTRLGASSSATLLLALGNVRPYKQLELLIEDVREAVKTAPSLRLLIRGKGEAVYVGLLQERLGDCPALSLEGGFVPDAEVALYLAGADYAVFGYGDSALSSGAMILALSYGLSVITLPCPAAEIVQEGVNGYIAADHAALRKLLLSLPSRPRLPRAAVVASVATATPERVAQELRSLYASLF